MFSSDKTHPSPKISEFNIASIQAYTRPADRPTLLKQLSYNASIKLHFLNSQIILMFRKFRFDV